MLAEAGCPGLPVSAGGGEQSGDTRAQCSEESRAESVDSDIQPADTAFCCNNRQQQPANVTTTQQHQHQGEDSYRLVGRLSVDCVVL